METGRENVNNNEFVDAVMDCESVEYSVQTLANTLKQEKRNDWVLEKILRNSKKR